MILTTHKPPKNHHFYHCFFTPGGVSQVLQRPFYVATRDGVLLGETLGLRAGITTAGSSVVGLRLIGWLKIQVIVMNSS